MTLDEYQSRAGTTMRFKGTQAWRLNYASVAMGGEAGEYLDSYKKHLRTVDDPKTLPSGGERDNMLLELGDTLWYLSCIARELDSSLEQVAQMNLDKLAKRHAPKETIG